jgi:hypothetical protein
MLAASAAATQNARVQSFLLAKRGSNDASDEAHGNRGSGRPLVLSGNWLEDLDPWGMDNNTASNYL